MSNNENTADLNKALNNINEFVHNVASQPAKYTIHIADDSGHSTESDLLIDEAVEEIIKNAESNARWIFINGKKFEFNAGSYRTEENNQKLKAELEVQHNPEIMLTGVLRGGYRLSR